MWRHQLPAILPVNLITVVFFWIMRSRNHHPGVTTQMPDGKGQGRGGVNFVEDKNLDAICRKYLGSDLCKIRAVVARVECYGCFEVFSRK